MLGVIGRIGSNFLRSRGFVIYRPTEIEKEFSRSYWKQWFARDPVAFANVYNSNRATIARIKHWPMPTSSLWNYGVLREWERSHPLSLGLPDSQPEITASDILGFVGRQLGDDLRYLEIGVSVGKNLIQMCDLFPDAKLFALDVEEPSPVLLNYFDACQTAWKGTASYEVETQFGERVSKTPSLYSLSRTQGNAVAYLSADQFRDDTWARLESQQFNMVFSDGVHSAECLHNELQFLLAHQLIDLNRFTMFWDDLTSLEMQSAFLDCSRELCQMFHKDERSIAIYNLYGSYGNKRQMGIFSTFAAES